VLGTLGLDHDRALTRDHDGWDTRPLVPDHRLMSAMTTCQRGMRRIISGTGRPLAIAAFMMLTRSTVVHSFLDRYAKRLRRAIASQTWDAQRP
jgi:hypothetical protein